MAVLVGDGLGVEVFEGDGLGAEVCVGAGAAVEVEALGANSNASPLQPSATSAIFAFSALSIERDHRVFTCTHAVMYSHQ